jgi:hypothetical protein
VVRGTWHAGQHPPIVDEVTYEREQDVREHNGREARAPSRERPHAYLLTDFARCAACDMALTSATTTNKIGQRYHCYRCVATPKEAQSDCPVRQLPADALTDAVFAIVRRPRATPRW